MAPTQAQATSLSPPPPQVTISGQPHFRRPRISPPKPADRIDIDIDYMISISSVRPDLHLFEEE